MKIKKLNEMNDFFLNIESELNIIDDINIAEINGQVPNDAQYAMLNPSGEFIQKFFKFKPKYFNDGTSANIFHYWGEQGGWIPSIYNSDSKKLKDVKFLKIILNK